MQSVKEELLVLTMYPFQEKDLIIVFFSGTQGKLSTKISGAKNPGSKNYFGHQPGELIFTEYLRKENSEWIRLINHCSENDKKTSGTYDRLVFREIFLEFYQKYSFGADTATPAFFFLKTFLQDFETTEGDLRWFFFRSLFQFAGLIGHRLCYEGCYSCRNPTYRLSDSGTFAVLKSRYEFVFQSNTLRCENCSVIYPYVESWFIKLCLDAENSEKTIRKEGEIPRNYMEKAIGCLIFYVEQVSHLRLRSRQAFEKMTGRDILGISKEKEIKPAAETTT